jgi:hypothetical protein
VRTEVRSCVSICTFAPVTRAIFFSRFFFPHRYLRRKGRAARAGGGMEGNLQPCRCLPGHTDPRRWIPTYRAGRLWSLLLSACGLVSRGRGLVSRGRGLVSRGSWTPTYRAGRLWSLLLSACGLVSRGRGLVSRGRGLVGPPHIELAVCGHYC